MCATSFNWSPVRIGSCIRVDDSLDGGLSFLCRSQTTERILDDTRNRPRRCSG